jgi:hypothetical protein
MRNSLFVRCNPESRSMVNPQHKPNPKANKTVNPKFVQKCELLRTGVMSAIWPGNDFILTVHALLELCRGTLILKLSAPGGRDKSFTGKTHAPKVQFCSIPFRMRWIL